MFSTYVEENRKNRGLHFSIDLYSLVAYLACIKLLFTMIQTYIYARLI